MTRRSVVPYEALVLPVGHDVGARSVSPSGRLHQVRVGSEVMDLTDPEYVVWALAHGIAADDRPMRRTLAERTASYGLDRRDSGMTIDRFLDDGLLIEVGAEPNSAIEFARHHQLIPLAFGLGPDPDHPGLLLVGALGQPLAQLSAPMYDLWTWAHLSPNLWQGCEEAVAVAQRQGVTNPGELDPELVLGGVVAALHDLLRVRAAYLDRRAAR
ncbi:hypothetical protein E1263_06220 [Kribbella antibiotica]|uniref:Uncharacterized protein n=1 Tax=Kribbella antibiotica TaxID=190195 RepID=A0A4R4ZSK3_9ACTN|nr:hypothetical protein [Kribbella antibiotica]TDD61785.1 hypothetical protein E1263_06220 [Kribbella antibiotica]